jgi:cell division protein DivIC
MDKLKVFYQAVKPYLNKYLITILLFLVFVVFVDENSLVRRVEYNQEISKLKKEIRHYRAQSEQSERRLQRLRTSKAELERVAREEYLMKKPDEEVFIVE